MNHTIQTPYGAYTLDEQTLLTLLEENQHLKNEHSEADQFYAKAKELEVYQAELIKVLNHIETHAQKVVILFEGRDAAGKGSLIGTISQYLNPKHCRTVALGRPTKEELSQWYFQKYIKHFPKGGELVLFDRSWYNRAMVEPVFNFCTQKEYELFLETVVPFERTFIEHDVRLIKIYLSVTKKTQMERFGRRQIDPLRQWKLSEIDMQAQAMWDKFTEKKRTMLARTNTKESPWHIIRSDDKHQARIEAIKLILRELKSEDMDIAVDLTPNPNYCVSVEQELTR